LDLILGLKSQTKVKNFFRLSTIDSGQKNHQFLSALKLENKFKDESLIKAKRLVQVTRDCMMLGIDQVKPGARLGDIGYAIQTYTEKNGFSQTPG
jgi:methionine aminopeptidase